MTVVKVMEAHPRDVGKGLARLDPELMEQLGIQIGDSILIEGSKKTGVLAYPGNPEDTGKRGIR